MPCLSIIIPVHNTAGYLQKCVDSVRAQTLSDIEIILAENLSDDGSYELCDEIAVSDSRIKVIHLDIAGLSHARNCALKVASAPYIGYVDSDDFISNDMYENMYGAAIKYNADVVYCNFRRFSPDMPVPEDSGSGAETVRRPDDVIADMFMERISSSACTKIFRKELLENNPFPEGMYFEDHAVVYRIIGKSSVCVHIDRDYYYYLQRDSSICHTLSPEKEYHFFMAEYDRIGYLDKSLEIPSRTKDTIFRMQVLNCFLHLKNILKMKDASGFGNEISDMRSKLLSLKPEKQRMNGKLRYRLFRLEYLWPLFRLSHSL